MRFTPLFLLAPMVLVQAQANEFFTTATAQNALFPRATAFTATLLALDDAARDEIERLSEVRQRWKEQPVWQAMAEGQFLGWYLEDRVIGKHEFIRYAVAISPEGKILGVEIMEYLETYGDQVREASWRGQFLGRDDHSGFKLGRDIQNISGATLSCRNITNGIKRVLVLQSLYLKPPQ